MRFTSALTQNTIVTYHSGEYFAANGYQYTNQNRTYTSSNWNTYQNVAVHPTDAMSNLERNQIWLTFQNSGDVYCVDFLILERDPGNNIYSIIATKY